MGSTGITKQIFFWLGPLMFLALAFLLPPAPDDPVLSRMAGITAWVAIWWMTEAVEIYITSLLPFALMPLLGIADAGETASRYMDQVIFLFIGGFLISFAIEKWNLHKRISLTILHRLGSSPQRVLAGVMGATFFLSMWISNTATVMMMLAAVLSIISEFEKGLNDKEAKRVSTALLIGLAYAASIGGLATLVGTPTNMIFYSFFKTAYPQSADVNFITWSMVAFPAAVAVNAGAYFILRHFFLKGVSMQNISPDYFSEALRDLGPMSREEKKVLLVFFITVVLWFTRSDIVAGSFEFKGWAGWLGPGKMIQDSTVAVIMAFLLFLLPAGNKGEKLLEWKDAREIPFGVILLFGSGFALAYGFETSGLSNVIATNLLFFADAPLWVLILAAVVLVSIISELASNVASVQLVLPIVLSLQKSLPSHPAVLMAAVTMAASIGFMLPVATAANTIVIGTQKVEARDMIRVGFWVDVVAIVVVWLAGTVLAPAVWK